MCGGLVQSQVSDMSPLPSERPETPTTFEHDVPVFRDVEADVDEASDVVCNVGLSTVRSRRKEEELHAS